MTTITLVVFPDGPRAVQGLAALEALQHQRSISVRGASLVERDEDGLLLLRKDMSGMLLGGGLGAVVARAPSELLEFLVRDLAPKTFALIAEASGGWLSKIGARLELLGGSVVAEWCMEPGDDARERRTAREAEPHRRPARLAAKEILDERLHPRERRTLAARRGEGVDPHRPRSPRGHTAGG